MRDFNSAATIIYLVVSLVASVSGWSFVISYAIVCRGVWYRSPMGRHLMGLTASLAGVSTVIFSGLFYPTYPGRPWVGIVLYALIAVFLAQRNVLLWRANRQARDHLVE